jgi:hypothetical protein
MDSKDVRGSVLCSEILSLHLQSRAGREREVKVNLEEIWSSGALIQTDTRIPLLTPLRFAGGGFEFRGQATARTLLKGLGYFIEMRFYPSCTWSEQKYRPKHLFNPLPFNPLVLLANRIFGAMPHPPVSLPYGFLAAGKVASASFKQASGEAF